MTLGLHLNLYDKLYVWYVVTGKCYKFMPGLMSKSVIFTAVGYVGLEAAHMYEALGSVASVLKRISIVRLPNFHCAIILVTLGFD